MINQPDPTLANLSSRIDLKKALVLVIEPNSQACDVLTQIMLGFGATRFLKAASHDEAQEAVSRDTVDLILCEGSLQPGQPDGYDFVNWLRRSGLEPNGFAPVILISSHTSTRNVARSRDCGAHFMISKPLIPSVLLDRITWIAQQHRTFLNSEAYTGPDRRFQNVGPPPNMAGRRAGDLSARVGRAVEPNMDQHEIDNLLPQRKGSR